MAKTNSRPISPGSTITTTSVKSGPGGRQYTTRIEKSKPTYSYKVETQSSTQLAIPEEVELDGKHFRKWPGILKLLQLGVAILCMIFFSPPLTWFTRVLCAVVASCFAITIFVCLFYLFTLRRVVMPSWNWLKIETYYTNVAAALYLVASLLQLIYTNKEEYKLALEYHNFFYSYIIAGALGLVNFVLYGLGGQLLDNKLKAQRARQPTVCIVKTITTTDRRGRPIKKTIKKTQRVKVHKIETV